MKMISVNILKNIYFLTQLNTPPEYPEYSNRAFWSIQRSIQGGTSLGQNKEQDISIKHEEIKFEVKWMLVVEQFSSLI